MHLKYFFFFWSSSTKSVIQWFYESVNMTSFFGCCFFLAVLGFEFRALHLLGRWSPTWASPLALFALVISGTRSHIFAQVGLTTVLTYVCCVAGIRSEPPYPLFYVEVEPCQLPALGLSQITILPISTEWLGLETRAMVPSPGQVFYVVFI
jgi:hypothetical protein